LLASFRCNRKRPSRSWIVFYLSGSRESVTFTSPLCSSSDSKLLCYATPAFKSSSLRSGRYIHSFRFPAPLSTIENDPAEAGSFSICRGAGNRTRATPSQTAYTTIMLHPDLLRKSLLFSIVVRMHGAENSVSSLCFFVRIPKRYHFQSEHVVRGRKWTLFFDTATSLLSSLRQIRLITKVRKIYHLHQENASLLTH
jgi:hypothetical protein